MTQRALDCSTAGDAASDGDVPAATGSDAFQALAGDPRVRVLGALADAPDGHATFTELFEATTLDTTAGFAYHLRQLDGRFVRKVTADGSAASTTDDADRYELTDAGRRVVRAVAAGAYTESVDLDPIPLDDACPLCDDADGLRATVADNVTTVGCAACERDVLALPFPPTGYATRDPDAIPAAVDRHHRRRLASFADDVCPDCGAPTAGVVEPVADERDDDADVDPIAVRARFACDACGASLAAPLSLALLDHPAVVAAYHDHDVDVRDRSLWTVGRDWRERVLSTDPWCVRATLRSPNDDDEDDGGPEDVLAAYVGRDCTVVDVDRLDDGDDAFDANDAPAPGDAPDAGSTDEGSGEDGQPA